MLHDQNHWVTVSSVGCPFVHVKLYDSGRSGTVSITVKQQIATILHTSQNLILVDLPQVQKQSGSSDCGLFAIAYATSVIKGEETCNSYYTQRLMRSHLLSCLEKMSMSVFPRRIQSQEINPVQEQEIISVFCLCRQLQSRQMLKCSVCGEQYHHHCVSWKGKAKSFCCEECKTKK